MINRQFRMRWPRAKSAIAPARFCLLVLAAATIAIASSRADSDTPPGGETAVAESTHTQIAQKQNALKLQLDAVRKSLSGLDGGDTADTYDLNLELLNVLKDISQCYEQQLIEYQENQSNPDIKKKLQDVLKELKVPSASESTPAVSLPALEKLKLEKLTLEHQIALQKDRVRAETATLRSVESQLKKDETSQQSLRQALDYEHKKAGDDIRLRIIDARLLLARERVLMQNLVAENEVNTAEIYDLRTRVLDAKVKIFQQNVTFDRNDLNDQLVEINSLDNELRQQLEKASINLNSALQRMTDHGRNVDHRRERDTDNVDSEGSLIEHEIQKYKREIFILEDSLTLLSVQKDIWNLRYRIFNDEIDNDGIRSRRPEIQLVVDKYAIAQRVQQKRVDDTIRDAQQMRMEIDKADKEDPRLTIILKERHKLFLDALQVAEQYLAEIKKTHHLCAAAVTDVDAELISLNVYEWFQIAADWASRIWNFEIGAVDNRSITVKKIIIALITFIGGGLLARYYSGVLVGRLVRRFKIRESSAHTIRTITFYFFICFIAILALFIANIPLTIFTVIGGALAIGVGFGSQNILNNFISGLIILTERLIKVGDQIELGNTFGRITKIGPRCTMLRNSQNIDILVPNSALLENNVVNWTLADDTIRTQVTVGVVYGSPTDIVTDLLIKAANECDRVIAKPEPVVLFRDFGDNALMFEVHFWIHFVSNFEKSLIESNVRYTIDKLFRDANLIIAFPQRDIHLDTISPLNIRLLRDGDDSATDTADANPKASAPP